MKLKISIDIDGVAFFQPSAEEMKPVFNYVYRKLGFVVIGQPRTSPKFKIGATINTLMQFRYEDDLFEVYERGTAKDWIAQARLIKQKTPDLDLTHLKTDGTYWHVRPVARQGFLQCSPRRLQAPGTRPGAMQGKKRAKKTKDLANGRVRSADSASAMWPIRKPRAA